MGKKNKKEKKQKGADKTARKTDKNLEKKMKKSREQAGEDDIEALIAEFKAQDRKKTEIVERKCEPPAPRNNFSFTANRERDEIYLFGGEFHDGKKTTMFNDLYVYSAKKNEWRCIEAPNAPPPRSAHQSVLVRSGGGDQLWVFGGEFVSPTETQFYHYRDLWCWHFREKRWEQLKTNTSPKARSGHRMIFWKKALVLFGGFNDTGRSCAYFNDLWHFDLTSRQWREVRAVGPNPPMPRSACLFLPSPDGKGMCVIGGYCRAGALKGTSLQPQGRDLEKDKGHVYTDMFSAVITSSAAKGDAKKGGTDDLEDLEVRWRQVRWSGAKPDPPRAGMAAVSGDGVPGGCAVVFGGVHDQYEDAETVQSFFFNELFRLELDKGRWQKVFYRKKKTEEAVEQMEALTLEDAGENTEMEGVTVSQEGAFTLTVGGSEIPEAAASTSAMEEDPEAELEAANVPGPRMNCGMAVLGHRLFVFGGQVETEKKERALDDLYSLDLHRLESWVCLHKGTDTAWVGEDSSDSETEMDAEDDEDDDIILDAPAPTEGESFTAYWERTGSFWSDLIVSEMNESDDEDDDDEELDPELLRKYAMKTARDFHKGFGGNT